MGTERLTAEGKLLLHLTKKVFHVFVVLNKTQILEKV